MLDNLVWQCGGKRGRGSKRKREGGGERES